MRNFEYAILDRFSAKLSRGRNLGEFKTQGWILSRKTNIGSLSYATFKPNEEMKNLEIELKQRREKWSNQFSGKRSRRPSDEEKNQENIIGDPFASGWRNYKKLNTASLLNWCLQRNHN